MDANILTLPQATTIPRAEHVISRANISPNALKVLYRLKDAGFQACLVGGGVRDLLLLREPKDFDICTNAHPEQVRDLFRNCRLIGRRFRLAHVHFGREIIEVATFRALHGFADEDDEQAVRDDSGRILSDNIYGTIEEDAVRRDFTVNALYYDIATFAVLDFVGGIDDVKAGVLRLIGDPEQRYREDPVRMLRAIRFAAKLGFRIDPATEAPIHRLGDLLESIPSARLFDETLKLFMSGHAQQSLELLQLYGLLEYLLPLTVQSLHGPFSALIRAMLKQAMYNTDARIAAEKPVTPAFLYATFLWYPVQEQNQVLLATGMHEAAALSEAAESIVEQQIRSTSLPRRFSVPMREIWTMQMRFEKRSGKRAGLFLQHPRFRAAYDFLVLRAAVGEDVAELAQWWTEFQEVDEAERQKMLKKPGSKKRRQPRRTHKPLADIVE